MRTTEGKYGRIVDEGHSGTKKHVKKTLGYGNEKLQALNNSIPCKRTFVENLIVELRAAAYCLERGDQGPCIWS
jgi:hypothetical protein